MPASDIENRQFGAEQADIIEKMHGFVDALPNQGQIAAMRAESEQICNILEPLGFPPVLLAAVHACPLVRNDYVTLRSLQKIGNSELPKLVEGLVQLSRFSLPRDWQPGEALAVQQSEALRKMLLAVVSDARLVLVRIAEQLYRLRLAKKSSRDEQRAIAVETQEVYAPLANRLGVWQLKWELEDLSLRYLEPETYKQLAESLKEKRTERETYIVDVIKTLQDELVRNDIEGDITGRPKHIYSIWKKMQAKNRTVEQIFDMRAVRILVDDVHQCYAALGVVHNLWPYLPGEFDDYIANPKDNNYQSLHTAVIGPQGKTVEIQIRTHEMHRHAELGVAAHWRYKEGGSTRAAFDQKIQFLRQLLEPGDQDGDLLDKLRGDVFEDRVYAVSPRGDVVEMPANATPLDFAYHVHTQIGHRCRGAKVNGRIVPLTYKIQNGDNVEIITGKQEQPSRDWLSPQLGYLVATRSRSKVRTWFRQRDKEQNKRQGREILERELTRLNVHDISTADIAGQLKYASSDALFIALGAGDITSASVASALQHLRQEEPAEFVRKRRTRKRADAVSGDIAVSGVGDLLCNFARCCRPVPPEDIAGYITLGRGVSIHRQDCGNYLSLQSRHPERVIEVDWGTVADATYPAKLSLHAFDRQGLLRDISAVLSDEKVSVDGINTRSDKRTMQAHMELNISVPGLEALSRLISRLEQLPNVTSVRRKN
jgi:GTP pyrophosphokinase